MVVTIKFRFYMKTAEDCSLTRLKRSAKNKTPFRNNIDFHIRIDSKTHHFVDPYLNRHYNLTNLFDLNLHYQMCLMNFYDSAIAFL